jgi:hypothetical protein
MAYMVRLSRRKGRIAVDDRDEGIGMVKHNKVPDAGTNNHPRK